MTVPAKEQEEEAVPETLIEEDLSGKIIPFRGRFAALPDKDLGQGIITLEAVSVVEEIDPNIVADNLEKELGYQVTEFERPERFNNLPAHLTGSFTKSTQSAMAFRIVEGELVADDRLLNPEYIPGSGQQIVERDQGIAVFKPTPKILSMVGIAPIRSLRLEPTSIPSLADGQWHTIDEDLLKKKAA